MSDARILELGYLPYDGPRKGLGGALRSTVVQTVQRALGIRRGFWPKVFPIIAATLAYLPAIAFVGISVFFKDQLERAGAGQILPTYGQYYGFVWGAILLFTAFVAPGVLCTDRRNGLFGLSLASPLNRTTYLLAKAGGVSATLAIATLGPPLLLLVANVLNEQGPAGVGDLLSTLGKILVAGLLVTALHVSFSLAVASTTTRWAAASAAIVVIFFASSVLTGILVRRGGLPAELFAFDIVQLPFDLVLRLFGDRSAVRYAREVDTGFLVVAYLAWTAVFSAFAWWRYQRIQVAR